MCAIVITYMHAYIPTYIHTYLPTYIQTYIHACIHTYLHTCMHAYIPAYIHTYLQTYIHTYAYILICFYLCILYTIFKLAVNQLMNPWGVNKKCCWSPPILYLRMSIYKGSYSITINMVVIDSQLMWIIGGLLKEPKRLRSWRNCTVL